MRFEFTVTCPDCGARQFAPVASSAPPSAGSQAAVRRTVSTWRCNGCAAEWMLTVTLAAVDDSNPDRRGIGRRTAPSTGSRRRPPVCGWESGYQAHRKRGETPCAACKTGHARYNAGELPASPPPETAAQLPLNMEVST